MPADPVVDAGRTLILADGAAPARADLDAAWPGWDAGVGFVVAADGGARHANTFGLRLDLWVGDGDSIEDALLAELAASGVRLRHAEPDKDESDTELALLEAIAEGASEISILGALGGVRVDHALANVALLQHPALEGRLVTLFDERASRISLLEAGGGEVVTRDFEGGEGDLVSLLPLGGPAAGVATEGLRYRLADEPLELGRSRGLSNVRTAPSARISLGSGRLLVIETPARFRP
jgi:thiamine pyrophosphokinase